MAPEDAEAALREKTVDSITPQCVTHLLEKESASGKTANSCMLEAHNVLKPILQKHGMVKISPILLEGMVTRSIRMKVPSNPIIQLIIPGHTVNRDLF